MKKLLILLALLLLLFVLAPVTGGCDYITGQAFSTNTLILTRWAWDGFVDGHAIVIDRDTGNPIKDVTPEEAFGIIGTSQYLDNPVVIDVRTPPEYANGHIHKSINIDYNSTNFKAEISNLDKAFTYIVYCQTGYRSNLARKAMEQLGFNHVINMMGGFGAWAAVGLPVEK